MRVARAVFLSPEERAVLERWAAGPDRARAVRARIVLAAAAGASHLEIGSRLGVSRFMAARWRERFLRGRLRAIRTPEPRLPPTGRLTESQLQGVLRAGSAPSLGRPAPPSSRSVARRFRVSHTTVRRIWAANRTTGPTVPSRPARPDPRSWGTVSDVLGIFLRPSGYLLVFTLDSAAGPAGAPASSARTVREGLTVPTGLGLPPSWVGVVQSLTRTAPVPEDSPDVADPLRFLQMIVARAPRGIELLALALSARVASDPRWRAWRLRHPGVHVELAAGPAAWSARALALLREIDRRRPRPLGAESSGEVSGALRRAIAAYSSERGAFEWAATRAEIKRRSGATGLRYELSVTAHPAFKTTGELGASMAGPAAPDPRLRPLARAILRRYLRVRPRERVLIESWSSTIDYANALVLEALRAGAVPLLVYQDEPTYWAATTEVPPEILGRIGAHQRAAVERTDAMVTFFGPSDRERFHALPRRTNLRLCAREDEVYRAAERTGVRGVQLALGRLSPASARMYGVDLRSWRDELIESTLVDPTTLRRRGRRVAAALERGRELTVSHPNGTSLTLRLAGRRADVADGLPPDPRHPGPWTLTMVPAGVVSVALHERTADGRFRSNVPNSVGISNAVGAIDDATWTFRGGRLVGHRYREGGPIFDESFERAGAGRDRVGVLSIGLNPRLRTAPLLQDQALGTVTLQIGRNHHLGGANRVGWWAWLLLRGASVRVDGRPLLDRGRIVE